ARFFSTPLLPVPSTLTFRQTLNHSSPSMRSTCPNNLNLPLLTTSTTHSIPRREIKSTLFCLLVNFTSYILLTTALSIRSNLLVLILYLYGSSAKTLCTQAL